VSPNEVAAALAARTPGRWVPLSGWPRHIVVEGDANKSLGGASDPDEDRERYATVIAKVRLDDITLRDHPEVAARFPHRRVHREQSDADARAIVVAVNLADDLWRVAEAARAASGILDALDAQAGPPPGPEHLVTVTTEAWTDSIRPRVKVLREALADLDATREEMP